MCLLLTLDRLILGLWFDTILILVADINGVPSGPRDFETATDSDRLLKMLFRFVSYVR